MAWLFLMLAIASEVAATIALRSAGGGSPIALGVMIVGYAASFVLLWPVLKHIEVGTAYAVWAGLGTAAIALIGVFAFHESAGILKLASVALIVAGVVGLNLSGAH